MFLVNVKKCLPLFKRVYVSSDDDRILAKAKAVGAIPIKRDKKLCGDTPNITVYRHAMRHMPKIPGFVAVQANSPNIESSVIERAKKIMQSGVKEVMTCHPSYKLYGSVWGMTRTRLHDYVDPYAPTPEVLIVDPSVDIHNLEDYEEALRRPR